MPQTTKILLGILILLLVVWGIVALTRSETLPNELFRVGVIESLSGNAAYYGDLNRQGVEIAKEELLEAYPNLQLELYHQDSLYTPRGGVEAYNNLQAQHGLDAVITHASPVALAIKPLAERDGILQMAVSASAVTYSSPNDLSFRVSAPTSLEAIPMARFIKDRDYTRLAILFFQNDIGVSIAKSLREELQSVDINIGIPINEGFLIETTDFRTQLARIRQANVDAIYVAGLASNIANILNQARELGISAQFLGFRASEDPVLLQNAATVAEGFIYTYAFDPKSSSKKVREFVERFRGKYDNDPDGYAAGGYAGLKLTVEVFIECGKDYDCMKTHLTGLQNYPSIFGPLSFNENGDVSYEFFLKTVRNGQFVRYE